MSAKLHSLDINQLDIEKECCIGWNCASDTIAAVPHLWWHSQLPLVPNPHASYPPVPPFDHLANTWRYHSGTIST